jgi:hypothetical protein
VQSHCLTRIFSHLAETYVRSLKGEIRSDEVLKLPNLNRIMRNIKKRYQFIDTSLFETAVTSFFRNAADPDYSAIKWNLAQNFYVAKAIGIDSSGQLLSAEVFGNSVFYLDTNVIIAAVEPKNPHHESFKALRQACQQLQIELKVCQISLNELRTLANHQRELISEVVDQIPEDTAPKVGGLFFDLYRDELEANGSVDLNELFRNFTNPMPLLGQDYGVELVDNYWFDKAKGRKETIQLVTAVNEESVNKRGRRKSDTVALHDALVLRWVQKERENGNTWLATLDNSLPRYIGNGKGPSTAPLAIGLDAVLQWISPLAIPRDIEDDVAEVFSEAVKYQLLPQDSFFVLQDFIIFAALEMECKELPAEDVEGCIRYLKTNAADLDPTNPEDREKLSLEVSRFFADPSRKHHQEVRRLESEVAAVREESQRRVGEFELERTKHDEESKRILEEYDNKLKDSNREIGYLKGRQEQLEDDIRRERLKGQAKMRLSLMLLLLVVGESVLLYLTWRFGEGANLLQRMENTYALLSGLFFVVVAILIPFVVGKERLRALDWPWSHGS